MVSSTLVAAALVAFVSAAAYGAVAWKLRKRAPTDSDDQWALGHFVLWWGATAGNILVAGLLYLAAAFDRINLALQLADSILQRVVLAASLWGLVTYLLYLVTGKRFGRLTGVLYAAHAAFMVSILLRSGPNGVIVGAWRTDLSYASDPGAVLDLVNFVLVILAPVAACIAYLVIAIRLPKGVQAEQRYRGLIVSTALIFWWTVAVVAGQRGSLDLEWLQLLNRALGLCAAVAIVLAYHPPAMLRRRWGGAPSTSAA
ncbi:MAG TPA: hypothetical protein VGB18_01015 [Candidatus Thermoplasmatota archaeon]